MPFLFRPIVIATLLLAFTGCGRLLFDTPFGRVIFDPVRVPLGHGYDLDAWHGEPFRFRGREYIWFPEQGLIWDPLTGRIWRPNDDVAWRTFGRVMRGTTVAPPGSGSVQVGQACMPIQVHAWTLGQGDLVDATVEASVALRGDWEIPHLDAERWPQLQRELRVQPDGHRGSPDPVRMTLRGDLASVLGYLHEAGASDIHLRVGSMDLQVLIDHDAAAVDVGTGAMLSIPLR